MSNTIFAPPSCLILTLILTLTRILPLTATVALTLSPSHPLTLTLTATVSPLTVPPSHRSTVSPSPYPLLSAPPPH